MDLSKALRLLHSKRAVLFTGSGFSFGAKSSRFDSNHEFLEFRSANDISKEMAELCGMEEHEGLGLTSQVFRDVKSDQELIDFLKKEFTVTFISKSHLEISKIDWMRQYTTNYDDILEKGCILARKKPMSVTMDTNPKYVPDKRNVIVHLNGFIENLTPETLDNEFKLTSLSYNQDSIKNSQWYKIFYDDLHTCDVIVFIGFSGQYDLEITRDLLSLKILRDKSIFVVGTSEKLGVRSFLKKYGEVYAIGLDGFVKEWLSTPVPVCVPKREFKSLAQICKPMKTQHVEGKDIFNLLWNGRCEDALIGIAAESYATYPYVIYRQQITRILDLIASDHMSFIVKSGLGNGKTIFLKELSYSLIKEGWRVWTVNNEFSTAAREIEEVCYDEVPTAIIIDNSGDRSFLLNALRNHAKGSTLVIFAERSSRFEVSFEQYYDYDDNLCEIDIDRLSDDEIQSLIVYLDRHGLWGTKAALSTEEKRNFIRKQCKSQLGKCIIGLLSSMYLTDAYSQLMQGIKNKAPYYRLVLYIMCARVYGFILDYTDLWDVLGTVALDNHAVRSNSAMKEIIDFDAERITFNSSILAEHLLKNHISPTDIIDFLGDIFEQLVVRENMTRKIKNQLRVLMQYRTLSKITKDNAAIFSLYERLSGFQYCQNHPQFWLQYGIAKTSNGDYPLARKYFETAYSLARSIEGYNTYQIDNHFAHLLLKESLDSNNILNPMDTFREIHSKLVRRKKGDEERHYIYRVAQDYPAFWNKVTSQLTPEERTEFKRACKEIVYFGKNYLKLPSATQKDMVKELLFELQKIIAS